MRMKKLPQRLPYEILVLAALALGSCDGPGLSKKQREEVSELASAEVGDSDALVPVRSQLDAIEQRLNM